MKKIISIGLAASLAFAGCSTAETNVSNGTITGESAAYMTVRKVEVAGTRADAGGYEQGTAEEQDVLNADFFFYDGAGNFVTTGRAWHGGTSGSFENGNVEFNGDTVVALKGLTDTSLPKYVVTILNCPAAFKYGKTLDEMEKLLSNEDATATDGGFKNGKYFIMTTSSYVRSGDEKYFVTALDDSNFVTDPGQIDEAKRVTIYVERLAAKVKVTFTKKEGVDGALVPVEGKDNTFAMKMTVAGDPNQAGSGTNIAAENIHIHFLGWALNATTKKSYMIKNIKTSWTDDELGFTFPWSEANNHRSYWGMSYNYGKTEELNYANANDYTAIDAPIYCAENTNTSAVVTANPENTITSALLFAEVTDVDGTALDLVRYNGIYYKEAHYIAYVFNNLKRQEALNYYISTVAGDETK